VHLQVYQINLNITLMQRYEHIKVLFFHSSLPYIVMRVMVLFHSDVLYMTICTCVFHGLRYISVSPDITEYICFYQGRALVLTPIQVTPHGTMSRFTSVLTTERCSSYFTWHSTCLGPVCNLCWVHAFTMFIRIVRCVQWSDHPVHHHADTQPHLASVKLPLTTASSTHHYHIESALPHLYRKCSHTGQSVLQ
jgi:hypothetical protein